MPNAEDVVLNLGADAAQAPAFVSKATDPVLPGASTPGDFAAQFPNPLDTTELVTMCEELSAWRAIPEEMTGLKVYTWREMTSLNFSTTGSLIGFADGYCPEDYEHDGGNLSVTLKNIGARKALTISDIMHSVASISAGYGINRMAPGFAKGEGFPGGDSQAAGYLGIIADLKAKEMQLGGTLVLNGWDSLLVNGDHTVNALHFDGIETLVGTGSGAHVNTAADASGTFSADAFDRFLGEACAKPTHIFGHPQAIQNMLSAYFQLGFQGSHVISSSQQERIVPGFNFAGEVITGVGRMVVVADGNFTRTNIGGGIMSSPLYPLRMTHNGEKLVYKITQIPLAFKDLAPGCTSIAFQIWAKTALCIKALCAQNRYERRFTGNLTTTCTRIDI